MINIGLKITLFYLADNTCIQIKLPKYYSTILIQLLYCIPMRFQ